MKKREILAKANSAQNWEKVETLIKLLVESGRIEKQDFYHNYYHQDLTDNLMFIYYSADSVVFVDREPDTNTFTNFSVKHRDYKLNKAVDR